MKIIITFISLILLLTLSSNSIFAEEDNSNITNDTLVENNDITTKYKADKKRIIEAKMKINSIKNNKDLRTKLKNDKEKIRTNKKIILKEKSCLKKIKN